MYFFYARISTKEQNLGRQLVEARKLGITTEGVDLFIDEQTGTSFNREGFLKLKETLKARNLDGPKGDVLYVHELDRFGRDYDEIKRNITDIEGFGVIIKFMDIPLIETSDETTNKLIRDQFIATLSYVAQKETEKRKERQKQGYNALSKNEEGKLIGKNGNVVGRPKKDIPKDFGRYYDLMQSGTMKASEIMKILGIKKSRFYTMKKEYEQTLDSEEKLNLKVNKNKVTNKTNG